MERMGKVAVLLLQTIIVCLFAIDRCTSCGRGSSEVVEGILGRNISLTCTILGSMSCSAVNWINYTLTNPTQMVSNTARTSVSVDGDRHVMDIFPTTPYDEGLYRCMCTIGSGPSANHSIICENDLRLFCQAEVVVNLESNLHKSRQYVPSEPIIVDASEGDRVKVKCSKDSTFTTNCDDLPRRESGDFTYSFKVLPVHHLCLILCQLQWEKDIICTFNFSLNVSTIEPSTVESSTTESSTQLSITDQTNVEDNAVMGTIGVFRVIIPVGIGIFIVICVGITFLFWFFVLSSKSSTKVRSGENVNKVNTTANNLTLNDAEYEPVERHSEGYEIPQQGFAGTNNFNCSMDKCKKVVQNNSMRVQRSNTYASQINPTENEHYSLEPTAGTGEYLEIEEIETEANEDNPGLSLSNDDGYEIPRTVSH
ncbi:hypothetical protein HOLleu_24695 [Holothuria leucospilota]|uniref:Ig-like domain-containing protein n=1 Tax=Holothuria leucospilota TaxID=206669 RepID=A0A9Q1BRZ1_HOLLE|nr:hypothetical protein HOLleu_24695 [Holothuria leucospilota]